MDHKYIRQSDNPGALINTDAVALSAYKARREAAEKQKEEFETLKSDVADIKSLLSQLVEKVGK